MKANLPVSEPRTIDRWAAMDLYGKIRAKRRGARRFVLHDGPPVRQWRDSHRARAQQDSQGPGRQIAIDGGLRRAVRARLGLSRAADRAQRRARACGVKGSIREGSVARGVPPRLPRVRRQVRAIAGRGLPAAGRARRLGGAVSDDGAGVPGRDRARAWQVRGAGTRLQRQEARALVPARSHGTRRGGGRARTAHLAFDLRRVSVVAGRQRHAGRPRARTCGPRRHRAHLDDDAVDDSGEPRDRVSSGRRLRRVRGRRPRGHRRPTRSRNGCRRSRAADWARKSRRSRAPRRSACSSAIRSTSAIHSASWPTT